MLAAPGPHPTSAARAPGKVTRVAGALLLGACACSAVFAERGPAANAVSTRTPQEEPEQERSSATDTTGVRRLGLSAGAERARTEALDKALRHLAENQRTDGGWDLSDARERAPVAVCALGSLALMSSGSPPGRGPYGAAVGRSVDFLLSRVDLTPNSATRGYVGVSGDPLSRMHGHGFATLALAEAYSVSPESPRGARLERALPAAVDLIQRTQGGEGGWYYAPRIEAEHEGSVTICLVQALRAARNAGLLVDREVIERAVDYVRRSQAPDGSFRYQLGSDRTSVALTAAAIGTLNAAGEYQGPAVQRGVDAIWRGLARRESGDADARAEFPHYERLYLAQALWRLGDGSGFWDWYASELQAVLDVQQESGAFLDRTYGSAYATASIALFLSLPDEFLPSFTR